MDAELEIVGIESEQTEQDEQICDLCKISYSSEQVNKIRIHKHQCHTYKYYLQ